MPTDDQLRAGTVLFDEIVGESQVRDNKWHTLARVTPDQGARVGGYSVFRLMVSGSEGDDANVYSVTLSLRDSRDLPPPGLEVLSYAPTVRVPDKVRLTELRFAVPDDADALILRNFDAANGNVAFVSTYRTVALDASKQNAWRESELRLLPEERGSSAALVVSGGDEIPNDVTLMVADGESKPVPIRLPARAWTPNTRPVPNADISLLADCGSVSFDATVSTDADGDGLSYRWEFGDGASSEHAAVVHRYAEPGNYRAVLRVTDSSGQVGSGSSRFFDVFVRRPPVSEAGEEIVAAPASPVLFDGTASRAGGRPIARYKWDFRDGTRAEGAKVSHAFAGPGRYDVILQVEEAEAGACASAVDQRTVRVNAAPVPEAGPDRRSSVNEVVTFDATGSYDPDGRIASYEWDMGDGFRAAGPNVPHAYSAPGTYTATLTVRDDSGVANSGQSDTVRVFVNAPPVPQAGPDRDVAVGEVIDFDASRSTDADGPILDYHWDFGDGSHGRGVRVPYAYRQPGTYEVALTVRDASNTSSDTRTDTLSVRVNAPPVADAGDDQVVTSSEVHFDATRSRDPEGAIRRYEWSFGDGSTGSGARPTHVYRKSGRYLVRLTVVDDSGTRNDRASDASYVTVNAAPIADAGPDQVAAPGQVLTFDGSRSIDTDGDLTGFFWDFRDGSTALGSRVSHAFDRPGIYQVRLRVKDDTDQENAIDYDEARVVINAPPVANAGPDRLAGPGDKVIFDAAGSFDADGHISRYRWDFSDAVEPVFGSRVVRSYASPGVFTARLTVTDNSGAVNGTAQHEVTVRINHRPVANAGGDIFTSRSTVAFDGSQSADADGNPLLYTWDFGDGTPPVSGARVTHTYADGGRYPVVLKVDDGTGLHNATNRAAITVVIDRPPLAAAGGNKQVCAGDVVVFDGTHSVDPEGGLLRYAWDFGDNTKSDIANPTKIYRQGGLYPVTLTVEDESGFATNRHTDRVVVRVDEAPLAVAGSDQTVCANKEVHFDGAASRDFDGVVNRFTWNFGDGTVGGGGNPAHAYARAGNYRVALTIEGDQAGQCDNTASDEMIVHVVEAPDARIMAPSAVAAGSAITLDGSSSSIASGRIAAWIWDFGDGTTGEGATVAHGYEKPGAYLVTLTINTEGGVTQCSAVTARHAIVVNAPPVAVIGEVGRVGLGEEVLFDGSASHDPDGGITAYEWDFGDGTKASGINVRHRFRESGRYAVTLTVTDDTQLPNRTTARTIEVSVNHAPKPVIAAPVAGCPGESLKFSGATSSDLDGEIVGYTWTFGDGATAEGAEVVHAYGAPGFYALGLVVDDGAGLNNSRTLGTLRFHVNQSPRAEGGPDRMVCAGDPVAFDASASVDFDGELVSYRWSFGNGSALEGKEVVHRFEKPGSYDVKLTVDDGSGASCGRTADVAKVTVNTPPVARALGDRKGMAGGAHDLLTFDASQSADADGQPLSFLWELGDGITRAGDRILHHYAQPGEYTVQLIVDDGSGLVCGRASEEFPVVVRRRE
ncbi:MAG: PKD domain-containing protein [Burkholderiaceae bacterium]